VQGGEALSMIAEVRLDLSQLVRILFVRGPDAGD
jgi:hypothetical protein